MSRGSISRDDVDREPKVAVVRFSITDPGRKKKIETSLVKVPHRSKEEVFDLERWEETKRHDSEIAEFVEDLRTKVEQVDSESDLIQQVQKMDLSEEVMGRVVEYLEAHVGRD